MPSHSLARKAHAFLLMSVHPRDEMGLEEIARVTGPSPAGMYDA